MGASPTFLRFYALALSGLLAAVIGCSSSTAADGPSGAPEDDGIAEDDAEIKSGSLAGTYRIDESLDPEGMFLPEWLQTLSLRTDGTFYADEEGVAFDPDGYNSQIGHYEMRGTYTFKKSADGKQKWIAFVFKAPDGSRGTAKYFYKAAQGGLRMSVDLRGGERDDQFLLMKLDHENAFCEKPTDCSLQNLPQPRCPGEWKCKAIRPDRVLTYTIDVCRYEGARCGG
jgi:hypothetical protein